MDLSKHDVGGRVGISVGGMSHDSGDFDGADDGVWHVSGDSEGSNDGVSVSTGGSVSTLGINGVFVGFIIG